MAERIQLGARVRFKYRGRNDKRRRYYVGRVRELGASIRVEWEMDGVLNVSSFAPDELEPAKRRRKSTQDLPRPKVGTWWRSRTGKGHSLGQPRECKVTDVHQGPVRARSDGTLVPGAWYVVTMGQKRSRLRLDVFLRDYEPA